MTKRVDINIILDSNNRFETIPCRIETDRSIRVDAVFIRYTFETNQVTHVIWIPCKKWLADLLTKRDSPLCTALLQLLMFIGELPCDFSSAKTGNPCSQLDIL